MFSWNQLGWWVYNLPTHLKRWFVQLTEHIPLLYKI